MSDPYKPFGGHHIWCNFSMAGPPETCTQCKGLKEKYPMSAEDPAGDALLTKHFPDAIPRK